MKKKPKYNVQYFIDKFTAIPSAEWIKGALSFNGKHCALGHCGERVIGVTTAESAALREIIHTNYQGASVIHINDGNTWARKLFPNKTVKGRVIAALKGIQHSGN